MAEAGSLPRLPAAGFVVGLDVRQGPWQRELIGAGERGDR
jgi:hypothetical protein